MPVCSPVGLSESNGRVENGVQRVQGETKTINDALEAKLKTTVRRGHAVLACIVALSAGILNRYTRRHTGRTAHTHKFVYVKCTHPLPSSETQSCTCQRRTAGLAKPKIVRIKSDETIIGTKFGVVQYFAHDMLCG